MSEESVYKKALMGASHGIALISSNQKVLLWNDWLAKTTSIASEEAVGREIDELFPSVKTYLRLKSGLQWCLKTGKYALISERFGSCPLPLVSDTGKPINPRIVLTPIETDGLFQCSMEIYDSSTYLAKEQYAREQHLKLVDTQATLVETSKLAALGEMAGGIAHELNTPLGTILLRANQIKRILEKSPKNVEKVLEFSDLIIGIAERISSIITGLRSFARAGESDPFVQKSVSELIQDTLSFCTARLENQGIEIRVDDCPVIEIECRPVQISQVLINLISNSQHAVQKLEGVVEKWISFSVKDLGDDVVIFFSDCGLGIPKEIRGKILQPFFTTKEVGVGTGLGLSISNGIIKDHGGEIKIDEEAKNTTFKIRLPKRQNKIKNAA